MNRNICVLLSASILSPVFVTTAVGDETQPAPTPLTATTLDNSGPVGAPVTYKNTMLIVVTSEGVAAIIFEKPSTRGTRIEYRYRFQPADGSEETTGNGHVFATLVREQYDSRHITAGKIVLPWSESGPESGWVYYTPETTSVQIAVANRFEDTVLPGKMKSEKVDLKRYLRSK